MPKISVLPILSAILWGLFAGLGIAIWIGGAFMHRPGYPSLGQILYYALFPLAMTILAVLLTIFVRKVNKAVLIVLSLLQFGAAPYYLFFYTGGV
jgi:glucan phosphoethanolaminetransferase (alkaline phosphatase superfamily)